MEDWTLLETEYQDSGSEGKVDPAILSNSGETWGSQGADMMVMAAVTPVLERMVSTWAKLGKCIYPSMEIP